MCHLFSRLHLLVALPVWLTLAQKGSMWQMLVIAEQYWECSWRTAHGVRYRFPRTIIQRIRQRSSESKPSIHCLREAPLSQMKDCSG